MASSDTPRRFNVRYLSKAVRSFTRRFRAPILVLLSIVFLFAVVVSTFRPNVARLHSLVDPHKSSVPHRHRSTARDTTSKPHDAAASLNNPSKRDDGDGDGDSDDTTSLPRDQTAPNLEKPSTGLGVQPDAHKSIARSDDPVREKWRARKMSAVILFHNEYDSLRTALQSWISNGLIAQIDEILFFVNGGTSESYFIRQIPKLIEAIPEHKRRIHINREDLKLGPAINKMVQLAKHEFVLLLEKDWALIENAETTASRLLDSKVIVGTGVAHLIRHRHRHNPGVPLHALIMHQGRESSIMTGQRNLMCFVHHWQKDPTTQYPGKGLMWRCGGPQNHLQEVDVFCSRGEYCQWNNNPCVFQRDWFLKEVGERYMVEYAKELARYGDTSPFLDFEYYTNWRSYAWTDKNFTVAVGEGLFSHAESEHKHFNTFWYANFRLQTDYEELRNIYLRNETTLKRKGGVHYDTSGPPPPSMLDRYPVEFARKFHWSEIFKHDLQKQREDLDKLYLEYRRGYRVSEDDWKVSGKDASNYAKRVPWRHYVTHMHFAVEKGELMVPPLQPHEMNITLVTTLMDIGRSKLDADDSYKFRRDFKMYLDKMEVWLQHEYPKVVYTTKDIAKELMKTASEKVRSSTRFVLTTREELASKWIGSDNYQRVQDIRLSMEWRERASWLANSPQAKLADYNPLVMAKMFMLRHAARSNFWNTTHFVFLDAKHNCMEPQYMHPKFDHILRAHMFGKFLLTYFDYTPQDEVHGFEYSAFNEYLNNRDRRSRQMVKVARGGIFGGSAYAVEYTTAMFDVVLTATLRAGLMGTEENILSILMAQVPQHIDPFSNNWACFRNVEHDHKCPERKTQGYNCEIFNWMKTNV